MSITIVDGQNEESIDDHSNNEFSPCLPMTIDGNKGITIIFSSNITSFTDWFPSICTQNKGYQNEYMFDGAAQWNIQNLRVNDYTMNSNDGYGLVRSSGDIICTQCHVVDITNELSDRPLLSTKASFHVLATTMIGVTTKSSVISANYTVSGVQTVREFVLKDCTFANITGYDNLLKLKRSPDDVEYDIASEIVVFCEKSENLYLKLFFVSICRLCFTEKSETSTVHFEHSFR